MCLLCNQNGHYTIFLFFNNAMQFLNCFSIIVFQDFKINDDPVWLEQRDQNATMRARKELTELPISESTIDFFTSILNQKSLNLYVRKAKLNLEKSRPLTTAVAENRWRWPRMRIGSARDTQVDSRVCVF